MKVHVGGSTIVFKKIWIGEVTLKLEFPRIHSLSIQKQAKVKEVVQRGERVWNLHFKTSLLVWEEELLQRIIQRLQGYQIKSYQINRSIDYVMELELQQDSLNLLRLCRMG